MIKGDYKVGCEPGECKSFLSEETFIKYKDTFMRVANRIKDMLVDFPNYIGCDFCDVSANGIQIRGHHKEIGGYTYGAQITIKYDFSNIEEVADEFVEHWKQLDNPSDVARYKSFLADGERYGWD